VYSQIAKNISVLLSTWWRNLDFVESSESERQEGIKLSLTYDFVLMSEAHEFIFMTSHYYTSRSSTE